MQLHQLITELTELRGIVGPHAPVKVDKLEAVVAVRMAGGGILLEWEGDDPWDEIEALKKEVEKSDNELDEKVTYLKEQLEAAFETKDWGIVEDLL